MLKESLSEILSHDLAFAWRTFTFDAVTKNILGLPTSSRPGKIIHFQGYHMDKIKWLTMFLFYEC